MDSTLIRGDTNELQCILDFQKRGYYCSIPFSGSCRYDVVVDINNYLYRIQCKSSNFDENNGVLKLNTTRQTTNTQSTTKYIYTKNDIDYFYTSWQNYGFLIPVEEVSTSKQLRVLPPKNGIQETMSIASDYLIDNVIDAIVNNMPIKKYKDHRFISVDTNNQEKLWSANDLANTYNERQIRYIKECINKSEMAYNLKWRYKEFPTL